MSVSTMQTSCIPENYDKDHYNFTEKQLKIPDAIARRFSNTRQKYDDLLSVANVGLVLGYRDFKPEKVTRDDFDFSQYLYWRTKMYVLAYLSSKKKKLAYKLNIRFTVFDQKIHYRQELHPKFDDVDNLDFINNIKELMTDEQKDIYKMVYEDGMSFRRILRERGISIYCASIIINEIKELVRDYLLYHRINESKK